MQEKLKYKRRGHFRGKISVIVTLGGGRENPKNHSIFHDVKGEEGQILVSQCS